MDSSSSSWSRRPSNSRLAAGAGAPGGGEAAGAASAHFALLAGGCPSAGWGALAARLALGATGSFEAFKVALAASFALAAPCGGGSESASAFAFAGGAAAALAAAFALASAPPPKICLPSWSTAPSTMRPHCCGEPPRNQVILEPALAMSAHFDGLPVFCSRASMPSAWTHLHLEDAFVTGSVSPEASLTESLPPWIAAWMRRASACETGIAARWGPRPGRRQAWQSREGWPR
mmetsp:Transcript_91359/g.258266  ORF Transcript_91359/g.258266 Transcript_91359/m.258266 type:complete len:233 (-) Transcript_91359:9-707(-)